MKVGSITHNRNLSVESKGSKEKANFSDSFNLARRAKTKEELELQMTEIKKTGEKLVATKCYGDVIQYKKLIKDYLKSVVDYIYDINKNTSFWDRNYFTTVKTMNEKLENMTRDLIYEEKDNISEILAKHIMNPVRFTECLKTMYESGIDTFIEIGPGKTLSGFVKRMKFENVKIMNINDVSSLEQVIKEVKENG